MKLSYYECAKRRVDDFAAFDVVEESKQAIDCLNCEAMIDFGIEALESVIKADAVFRDAAMDGLIEFTEELDDSLHGLIRHWLRTSEHSIVWIKKCESREYEVKRRDEFMKFVREAKSIIKSYTDDSLPEHIAEIRDEAIEEHSRGETLPLFSGME